MTVTQPGPPIKSSSLIVSSIAACLALAGAAIFTIGFASQQQDEPIASSTQMATTTSQPAADAPVTGGTTTADAELESALSMSLRAEENSLYTDPNCMATSIVTALGGAENMESLYGITVATLPTRMRDLSLSTADALAVTDGLFLCGFDQSLLSLIFQAQLNGEVAKQCGFAEFDVEALRDWQALGLMNGTDRANFENQAELAFGREQLRVKQTCREATTDATAATASVDDVETSDIEDLIASFEALVVPLGFEANGHWETEFARGCLNFDRWSLRFFEYKRGTDRVSLVAGAPLGLEASDFYDQLAAGPYDCELGAELFDFLHVGVDGEFDADYPYVRFFYTPPGQTISRHEHYLRRGTIVYVASSVDPTVTAELRDLVRASGPVG